MGFAEDMAAHEESWQSGQDNPRGPGGNRLPDGKHQAMIAESRVEKSNDGERWQFTLKFINPQGQVHKWQNLDNETGIEIAAQDAALLGYTGPLSGLEEACASGMFDDLVCGINVKTKPGNERDFVNVYLNTCLGKADNPSDFQPTGEGSSEFAAATAGSDDDIPF